MKNKKIQEQALLLEGVVGLALCWFKSSHPHFHFSACKSLVLNILVS